MNKVFFGDCRATMKRLIAEGVKVQTCVTSPPYWGLRDYGHAGQIGLEPTPEEYKVSMVEVFSLVRDLLSEDGTLWLNLGDSYASAWACDRRNVVGAGSLENGKRDARPNRLVGGLKEKDLVGIPWMVAFALRNDGWYLRSDIIWNKPNPMPESVTDRPTKSHEYLFLMSKNERYYYDSAAIAEPVTGSTVERMSQPNIENQEGSDRVPGKTNGNMKAVLKKSGNKERKMGMERGSPNDHLGGSIPWEGTTRNKRTVWSVTTVPFSGSHFATFPPKLIEPCIMAGSRPGDIVLDPFFGSGTTGQVAEQLGRQWIGCEIQTDYEPLQKQRTAQRGLAL
jgi:DNA modification methylase